MPTSRARRLQRRVDRVKRERALQHRRRAVVRVQLVERHLGRRLHVEVLHVGEVRRVGGVRRVRHDDGAVQELRRALRRREQPAAQQRLARVDRLVVALAGGLGHVVGRRDRVGRGLDAIIGRHVDAHLALHVERRPGAARPLARRLRVIHDVGRERERVQITREPGEARADVHLAVERDVEREVDEGARRALHLPKLDARVAAVCSDAVRVGVARVPVRGGEADPVVPHADLIRATAGHHR